MRCFPKRKSRQQKNYFCFLTTMFFVDGLGAGFVDRSLFSLFVRLDTTSVDLTTGGATGACSVVGLGEGVVDRNLLNLINKVDTSAADRIADTDTIASFNTGLLEGVVDLKISSSLRSEVTSFASLTVNDSTGIGSGLGSGLGVRLLSFSNWSRICCMSIPGAIGVGTTISFRHNVTFVVVWVSIDTLPTQKNCKVSCDECEPLTLIKPPVTYSRYGTP